MRFASDSGHLLPELLRVDACSRCHPLVEELRHRYLLALSQQIDRRVSTVGKILPQRIDVPLQVRKHLRLLPDLGFNPTQHFRNANQAATTPNEVCKLLKQQLQFWNHLLSKGRPPGISHWRNGSAPKHAGSSRHSPAELVKLLRPARLVYPNGHPRLHECA